MLPIRRIGTLRTLSFAVGVALALVSTAYAQSGVDGQAGADRPDCDWRSISGRSSAVTGDSRTRWRSLGLCAGAAPPRARRNPATRIAKCNSSTTRSCARRIPRSALRRCVLE
jgi:hypothetical protein